ncbi:hypothetical protein [Rheinheimera nanhaiensis]|uniref:PBP domain-containing protein n=1 Tax=Rheinheimera nanhaiensis E407-8 TaxID=562729 RepID=I1E2X4_9GAMM|nr:hypothetical protein [Rheinheimera nanhaiensis]GAB60652.1 hypothetical protein RNAN_3678 [Rheinheimera nanhaiensis E407-8]
MRWLWLLCLCWHSVLGATVVLVHPSVPVDSLTPSQLRNIFTLRQTQWPDGSAIRVLVLPEQAELHQRFSRRQLRLFPYQLSTLWDKHAFSGTGNRPQQVADSSAMLELLSVTPGAIGYAESGVLHPPLKEIRLEH